jgi:hypothetical protein
VVIVADSSYAAIDLLNVLRRHVCMVTRLRLDARLFAPPPRRRLERSGGRASWGSAFQPWPSGWLTHERAGGELRSLVGMAERSVWSRL